MIPTSAGVGRSNIDNRTIRINLQIERSLPTNPHKTFSLFKKRTFWKSFCKYKVNELTKHVKFGYRKLKRGTQVCTLSLKRWCVMNLGKSKTKFRAISVKPVNLERYLHAWSLVLMN